jgi:hypothetical protein
MRRLAAGLFIAALLARAGAQVPATANTAACELYPEVTCTSTNAGMNADINQLAQDTRDALEPVLALKGTWRFPVRVVVIMPDDPRAAKVHGEQLSVDGLGNTMRINVTVPPDDPDTHDFVQRQFVTALLWEKFFAEMKAFDANTRLDVVPVWLIEGLNEWLDREPALDREAIVRRAAQSKRAPTLEEITSWQEISPDRLLGLYQRALCYYLVNSLIKEGPKRDDFQQWLAQVGHTGPSSARFLFPTEAGWRRQLLEAPERAHDLIYSWDETASALAGLETIALPAKKPAETRVCTLDSVMKFAGDPALGSALPGKIFDLTALELRAHPGWQPVLEAYRFGLAALQAGKTAEAQKWIAQAQQRRAAEAAYHQKMKDYLNWFEVTKEETGPGSRFESYFSTAQAMEKMQGDPQHPNPMRTRVLAVESQL